MSTSSGRPPSSTQSWISGISRWQCGHQWATKMTIWTRPFGSMATGAPWSSWPWTTGAASPTAGSSVGLVNAGSGVPGDDRRADLGHARGRGPGRWRAPMASRPTHRPGRGTRRGRRHRAGPRPRPAGASARRSWSVPARDWRHGVERGWAWSWVAPFVGGMVDGFVGVVGGGLGVGRPHGQQRQDGQERDEGERRQADEAEGPEPDDRARRPEAAGAGVEGRDPLEGDVVGGDDVRRSRRGRCRRPGSRRRGGPPRSRGSPRADTSRSAGTSTAGTDRNGRPRRSTGCPSSRGGPR